MLKYLMWGIGIYIIASYAWGGYVAWRLHKLRQKMQAHHLPAEEIQDIPEAPAAEAAIDVTAENMQAIEDTDWPDHDILDSPEPEINPQDDDEDNSKEAA
ncbi:hypothetical protein [Poriferisphaera sp. WC338]|uniref:hypothetical protein n=1 Tax=Poriferisphaera sp. WC338 TaxID=3425129 RepID=UPI003D814307